MNHPLNVALVGYGYAGKTFHAPLIAASTGMKLALVVSRDSAKVKTDWPQVPVTANAQAAFADPTVDLVVIATPNDSHFSLGQQALLAGKHLVIDKPFTTTVAEARQLCALAEQHNLLLSVFHNRRWDADFLTLRRLIDEERLGDIAHFESHFDRYRPQVQPRWRESAGTGTGLWFDLGPHLADQALQLFGMPEAVYADMAQQRPGGSAVDYFHVLLRYARLRVVLHGSTLVAGGNPRFAVHGTQGSYIKYGLDTQESDLKMGRQPGCEGWGEDPLAGVLISQQQGREQRLEIENEPGDYRHYYQAVCDALLHGKPNPVAGHEAVQVMTVIELACQSAASHCEQAVDNLA